MSTRERWIIYPILFLTLGIAVRDKVIPPTRWSSSVLRVAGEIVTPQLRCKQVLVDNLVCQRMESGRAECHSFWVTGPTNRPVIAAGTDAKTHAGLLETLSAKGVPQVRLLSTPTGGVVNTIDATGQAQLVLGALGQSLGLFGQLPGREPLALTRPLKIEASPSLPQPPNKPATPAKPPEKPAPPKDKVGT